MIRVDLSKYVYYKMANWSTDWMDTTFDIFADLMESFNKGNKAKIKFENAQDPHEELVELEMKAADLRKQLHLRPLMESGDKTEEPASSGSEASLEPKATSVAFDPFKTLSEPEESQEGYIQNQVPPTIPEPVTSLPVPDMSKMSPIEQAIAQRKTSQTNILEHNAPQSTPEKPLVGLPSVNNEVLDQRVSGQPPVSPPQINKNPANQSKNPRFSKPNR